jgi:hypothetical protein
MKKALSLYEEKRQELCNKAFLSSKQIFIQDLRRVIASGVRLIF